MRGRMLLAGLLVATACALPARWGAPRLAPCPGPLATPGSIPGGDFIVRERVRVVGGGVDAGLELVAERRGDQLTVVGFNAFGAKAFSAVQRGESVEARSHLGPALEVPPENALRDLYAARFSSGQGGSPREPGERVVVERPGCGYTATFVRIERRELP